MYKQPKEQGKLILRFNKASVLDFVSNYLDKRFVPFFSFINDLIKVRIEY